MENARIIREGLEAAGLRAYGGKNAPYIWVKTPQGLGSWDFFDRLLGQAHVVTTPGAGFGPSGEGYVRLTAFGDRKSTRLNSSHGYISYAVFCLKKKNRIDNAWRTTQPDVRVLGTW